MSWVDRFKIAAALVAAVFLTSLVLSPDTWDKVKDRARAWWHPEPELPPSPRLFPWEVEKLQRQASAQQMQAELEAITQIRDVPIGAPENGGRMPTQVDR